MSFYQLLLFLFVSVLVFALLQLANAQPSKYLLDFTGVTIFFFFFFLLLENPMKQRVLDTRFVHLMNLKLKRFSEKEIENILLAPIFNSFF